MNKLPPTPHTTHQQTKDQPQQSIATQRTHHTDRKEQPDRTQESHCRRGALVVPEPASPVFNQPILPLREARRAERMEMYPLCINRVDLSKRMAFLPLT